MESCLLLHTTLGEDEAESPHSKGKCGALYVHVPEVTPLNLLFTQDYFQARYEAAGTWSGVWFVFLLQAVAKDLLHKPGNSL